MEHERPHFDQDIEKRWTLQYNMHMSIRTGLQLGCL